MANPYDPDPGDGPTRMPGRPGMTDMLNTPGMRPMPPVPPAPTADPGRRPADHPAQTPSPNPAHNPAHNALLAAANPLLLALASLRQGAVPASAERLRQRLLGLVADFDSACERSAVPIEQRHLARYALCTTLDEAIQRMPWSGNTQWAQQGLLVHHFRENTGGEKFYQVLDKLMQSPERYPELLQLFYVCLSLGFMGRYLLQDAAGRQAVAELRERLFRLIHPGQADPVLSDRWQGLSVAARRFKGFAGLWLGAAGVLLLCLTAYIGLALWLWQARDALALGRLALRPPPPVAALQAPPARPRLAQLLRAEIAAQQLTVSETRLESRVVLLSEAAFDSGSAVPAAGAQALMARVAAALDQVPGQVLVTGHTDNVPPRGLAYASNFELSTARARQVAQMLQQRLREPGRVHHEGRGDSEPVDDNRQPEGRARNRRVEVTLRADVAQP